MRTRWLQCWNTGSDTDHGDHTSVSWATDLEPVWSAAGSMFTGVSCPSFIVTWPVSSGCVDTAKADPERSPPKTNTGSRTEKTSGPLTVNMTWLSCSLGKSCWLWCNSSATTTTDDLSGALLNPLTIKLYDVRGVLKFDQTGAKFSLRFSFICYNRLLPLRVQCLIHSADLSQWGFYGASGGFSKVHVNTCVIHISALGHSLIPR